MIDSEQEILNNGRDTGRLQKIRDRLTSPSGGIYQGTLPDKTWAKTNIGQIYKKVILASAGIEKLGSKGNEYTVLGGWCAIRTRCMRDLAKGILTDVGTGREIKIESVEEVAHWITQAISADQIVESIGIYNGETYVAISEEKLWTEKVINALEDVFDRGLTTSEIDILSKAMSIAETKRFLITKQYIEYVTQKSVNFRRVIDRDIFNELVNGRDELLQAVQTSIKEIAEPLIQNRVKFDNKSLELWQQHKTIDDLCNYVRDYSLVWFMYTGPYLKILQDKGYVTTPKAIIMEPWSHGASNEAEANFKEKVFASQSGKNNYLVPGGLNEDLAFIAIDESSEYNFKPSKVNKTIAEVPNIINYDDFFATLKENKMIAALNLESNPSYMLGLNYLPYGKCREALLNMIRIKEDYREEKQKIKDTFKTQEDVKKAIQTLKKKESARMQLEAEKVNKELYDMFFSIFH